MNSKFHTVIEQVVHNLLALPCEERIKTLTHLKETVPVLHEHILLRMKEIRIEALNSDQ